MLMYRHGNPGFTIVELLIVVVVIAILATISIVAYTGIQNRGNDAAIQSDLKMIGKQFTIFYTERGRLPLNSTDFNSMDLRVARDSYGSHYASGSGYNMAYCPDNTSGTFVLVAASKSGNVFAFKDGAAKPGVGPMQTILTTCSNNGQTTTATYSWFYSNGAWQSYIKE